MIDVRRFLDCLMGEDEIIGMADDQTDPEALLRNGKEIRFPDLTLLLKSFQLALHKECRAFAKLQFVVLMFTHDTHHFEIRRLGNFALL